MLKFTPRLVLIVLLGVLSVSMLAAQTPPALRITDNAGNSVTVDGAGVMTFSVGCINCTGSASAIGGQVTWSGTLGTFSVVTTVGLTKPLTFPNPSQDLNISRLTTTADGSITFRWSDTNFTTPGVTGGTLRVGGVLTGGASSTYSAYFDSTNILFGTGTLVGTLGPFGGGGFSGTQTGPASPPPPFAMTEVATITLSAGSTLGVDFSFDALPAPLTLKCAASTGQVGVPYSSALLAAGGVLPYTYSISSGSLPTGLTLNASTGAITGTPTQAGTFSFTSQVVDSSGSSSNTTTASCSIIVTTPPPISLTCAGGTGQVGVPYDSFLVASGGVPPYSFSITSGSLPPGLTLNPTTGEISGTPATAGPFSFTAQVKDSTNTVAGTTSVNCGITIAPAPSASCVSITAVQGVPITPVTLTASGGAGGPYTFSATGLPAGLTMSSGGTISGTPTVTGTFNYTVTITDSAGHQGTLNCSVTVHPPISATCVSITAVQGVAITPVQLTATGGAGGPYTFTATGLPAGLSISSSGLISGTPTVSGTFNYTVTITDSAGNQGTLNCSVTVQPPPTATCVSITAVQGVAITPVTMTGGGGLGGPYTFSATGLPAGLSMSSSGTISGTPSVSGTFGYTVTVTDKAGNSGTVNCSVTVQPPVLPPQIGITKVADSATVIAGNPIGFTVTVAVSGGTATNVVLADALPVGGGDLNWTLNGVTGAWSPTITGTQGSQSLSFAAATLAPGTYSVHMTSPTTTADAGGTTASIASNFNGTAIQFGSAPGGSYVWYNSHFAASNMPTSGTVHFHAVNQFINFKYTDPVTKLPVTQNLAVPDADVIYTDTVTTATTTFTGGRWITTVPLTYTGNVFFSGLAFPVPANGLPGGINPVTWTGSFTVDEKLTKAPTLAWQWGAAAYSQFDSTPGVSGFQDGDYVSLGVKPVDATNLSVYSNSDHSGTPEAFKSYVLGGARGGGGSNFTGSWSGTIKLSPSQPGTVVNLATVTADGGLSANATAIVNIYQP